VRRRLPVAAIKARCRFGIAQSTRIPLRKTKRFYLRKRRRITKAIIKHKVFLLNTCQNLLRFQLIVLFRQLSLLVDQNCWHVQSSIVVGGVEKWETRSRGPGKPAVGLLGVGSGTSFSMPLACCLRPRLRAPRPNPGDECCCAVLYPIRQFSLINWYQRLGRPLPSLP